MGSLYGPEKGRKQGIKTPTTCRAYKMLHPSHSDSSRASDLTFDVRGPPWIGGGLIFNCLGPLRHNGLL